MNQHTIDNVIYNVIEETRDIESVGRQATYGIAATQADGGGELLHVPDISTDRATVEGLAERCNRLGVSPRHFLEVLEDFWGSDGI